MAQRLDIQADLVKLERDLKALKVDVLKTKLKNRGLPSDGVKPELVQRLVTSEHERMTWMEHGRHHLQLRAANRRGSAGDIQTLDVESYDGSERARSQASVSSRIRAAGLKRQAQMLAESEALNEQAFKDELVLRQRQLNEEHEHRMRQAQLEADREECKRRNETRQRQRDLEIQAASAQAEADAEEMEIQENHQQTRDHLDEVNQLTEQPSNDTPFSGEFVSNQIIKMTSCTASENEVDEEGSFSSSSSDDHDLVEESLFTEASAVQHTVLQDHSVAGQVFIGADDIPNDKDHVAQMPAAGGIFAARRDVQADANPMVTFAAPEMLRPMQTAAPRDEIYSAPSGATLTLLPRNNTSIQHDLRQSKLCDPPTVYGKARAVSGCTRFSQNIRKDDVTQRYRVNQQMTGSHRSRSRTRSRIDEQNCQTPIYTVTDAQMQAQATAAAVAVAAALRTTQAFRPEQQSTEYGREYSARTPGYTTELFEHLSMPKATLPPFDGNPLDYYIFDNAFKCNVHNTSLPDAAKLHRLIHALSGKAHKVISSCALGDPSAGYAKALQLLKTRFGDDFIIADACVKKLTSGLQIEPYDATGIQEFADDLRQCVDTLEAMGKIDEVDARSRLMLISDRLPGHLQNVWRQKAVDARVLHDEYPGIEMFLRFVETTARHATDPCFGYKKKSNKNTSYLQKSGKKDQRGTGVYSTMVDDDHKDAMCFAADVNPPYKPYSGKTFSRGCSLCNQDHFFINCPELLKMEPEKRVQTVQNKRFCYNCLKPSKHIARDCRSDKVCGVGGCTLKHAAVLHEGFKKREQSSSEVPVNHVHVMNSIEFSTKERYALPIVKVVVDSTDACDPVITYALLDPGSTRTFCAPELLPLLNLHGTHGQLPLSTLNEGSMTNVERVTFTVSKPEQGSRVFNLRSVYSVVSFPDMKNCSATPEDVRHFHHLCELDLPDPRDVKVGLLIGQDNAHTFFPGPTRRGTDDEPYAVSTPLGWAVNGQLSVTDSPAICNHLSTMEVERLNEQVEKFWQIDSIGNTNREHSHSVNDVKVIDRWDRSCEVVDSHYQLDIPFKSIVPNLPNNRHLAEKRLDYLERKLSRDLSTKHLYTTGIKDLIMKGYAEEVDNDGQAGSTWYIPHHSVTNPNKPGKIRIVFDCAASCQGTSLNKEVYQGPDLTNKLVGVLLRFREQPVGIMADIEAMFHQVRVTPAHRDVMRFLWRDDQGSVRTYRLCVHLFGGVWSPSAANYALQRTSTEFGADFPPSVALTVLEYFYVDDMCAGAENTQQGIELYENIREMLGRRGFNLIKFVSNDRALLNHIPVEHRAPSLAAVNLYESELPGDRSLGLCWDPENDVFTVNVKIRLPIHTKRGLLSILSSLYDPLGFIAPFILIAKIMLQDEYRLAKGWDDALEETTIDKLTSWMTHWAGLKDVRVPRYVHSNTSDGVVQLHHFCDASSKGYGTASYLRVTSHDGEVHCYFLFGKSRVAPIQQLSIVRLELVAAVIAVNMDTIIRREMRIRPESTHYWSDSFTVLGYIHNENMRFHTFTANKVSQIHSHSDKSQWRHVPGAINAADKASRGDVDLGENWLQAPAFLSGSEQDWPQEYTSDQFRVAAEDKEVKCMLVSSLVDQTDNVIDTLIGKISTWNRLLRRLAWLVKASDRFKRSSTAHNDGVQPIHIKRAEKVLVRTVQAHSFPDELMALHAKRDIPRGSSLRDFEPTIDTDGIMRATGRLENANVAEDIKHPVLLPNDHVAVETYLRHVHENEASHGGPSYMLSISRKKFWIVRASSIARRITATCVICKRLRHSAAEQKMAPLPESRVSSCKPPFNDTGIDCFGPFMVRRGRATQKRYGCVFTCFAVRAVHIEVLFSLDVSSFLDALRRFIARRGLPLALYSDNGTNFTGACKELSKAVDNWNSDPTTRAFIEQRAILWSFNTPYASHHGGVWERLIRSVRRVLEVTLRDLLPYEEGFSTLMCEVEATINGRPITPNSASVDDKLALSPSDLLCMRSTATDPPIASHGKPGCYYTKRWREIQHIADEFWSRWTAEYLPLLRNRSKWTETRRNVSVNDVVLVLDERTIRNQWHLGRVIETFPGDDGLVRTVRVLTKGTIYCRPVTKICLLETVE